MTKSVQKLLQETASNSPDLLLPQYQGYSNPLAGQCYVVSGAYFHLYPKQYKPFRLKIAGTTYWYLQDRLSGEVVDLTASQFKGNIPYSNGRACGFLTKKPSKRCIELLKRAGL